MRLAHLAVIAFVAPEAATCFCSNVIVQSFLSKNRIKKDSSDSKSRLNSVSIAGQQDELFPRQPSRSPFPLIQERQRRSNARGWQQQGQSPQFGDMRQRREEARAPVQESRFSLGLTREERFQRAVDKEVAMEEEAHRLTKEVAVAEFQVGRAMARLQTLEQQIQRDKEIARTRTIQRRKVYKPTKRRPYKYRGEDPKGQQRKNMLAGSAAVAGVVAVGLANGEYLDRPDVQLAFSTARSAATSISTEASKALDKAAAELSGISMESMDKDAVSLAAKRLTKAALNLETSIAASTAFVVDSASGELSSIVAPLAHIDENTLSSAATKLTKMAVEVETSIVSASERLLDKVSHHDSPTLSAPKGLQGTVLKENPSPIRLDNGNEKKTGEKVVGEAIRIAKVEDKTVNSNEKVLLSNFGSSPGTSETTQRTKVPESNVLASVSVNPPSIEKNGQGVEHKNPLMSENIIAAKQDIVPTAKVALSTSVDDSRVNRDAPIATLEAGRPLSFSDQALAKDKLDTQGSAHAPERAGTSIEEAIKSSPTTVAAMLSSFTPDGIDGSYFDTLGLETTEAQLGSSPVDWLNDYQATEQDSVSTVSPEADEVEPDQFLFLDPQQYAVDGVTHTGQSLEFTADGVEHVWSAETEYSTEAQFYGELGNERSAALGRASSGSAQEQEVNYQGERTNMIHSDHMESSTFLFLDPHSFAPEEEVVTDSGFEAAGTTASDAFSFPEHELSVGYEEYQDEQLDLEAFQDERRDERLAIPSSEESSSFLFIEPQAYATGRRKTEVDPSFHTVGSQTSSLGLPGLKTSDEGVSSEVLTSSESLHLQHEDVSSEVLTSYGPLHFQQEDVSSEVLASSESLDFQSEDGGEEMSQNAFLFLDPWEFAKQETRERESLNIDSVETTSMPPLHDVSVREDEIQARFAATGIVSEEQSAYDDVEASIPNSFLFLDPQEVADEVTTEDQIDVSGFEGYSAAFMVDGTSHQPEEMQVHYEDKLASSGTLEETSELQLEDPIQEQDPNHDEGSTFLFLDPRELYNR